MQNDLFLGNYALNVLRFKPFSCQADLFKIYLSQINFFIVQENKLKYSQRFLSHRSRSISFIG